MQIEIDGFNFLFLAPEQDPRVNLFNIWIRNANR